MGYCSHLPEHWQFCCASCSADTGSSRGQRSAKSFIPQSPHTPIDCEYADWSAWGECSGECGPGIHYRTRDIQVEAEHGGEGCVGPGQ